MPIEGKINKVKVKYGNKVVNICWEKNNIQKDEACIIQVLSLSVNGLKPVVIKNAEDGHCLQSWKDIYVKLKIN